MLNRVFVENTNIYKQGGRGYPPKYLQKGKKAKEKVGGKKQKKKERLAAWFEHMTSFDRKLVPLLNYKNVHGTL